MAELIPAGRFAPAAWRLGEIGGAGLDVGWCGGGTTDSYRACGAFVDRPSALAALAAMEAERVPPARETLLEAGFAREAPQGLQAGSAPYVLRRDGYAVAWLTHDGLTASLSVPGKAVDAPIEVAAIAPPHRRPGEACALTEGRDGVDLCVAGAVAAWRAYAEHRAGASRRLNPRPDSA